VSDKWIAWRLVGDKVDRPNITFTGKWRNELGSIMELIVKGDRVEGKYHTAVGAPGQMEQFDIVGVVNGDLISLVVNWGVYGSVTAWVGEQTADAGGGNERIVTMWQMVNNISEEQEKSSLWGAFMTGSDIFNRI
jgi:hypothetical protein